MDLLGIHPATIRAIACSELAFGALFFVLASRVVPGHRSLSFWAASNIAALAGLLLDAYGQSQGSSIALGLAGLLITVSLAFAWRGLRLHYNLPMPWEAVGFAAACLAVVGITIFTFYEHPITIIHPVCMHMLPGALILISTRDFVAQRKSARNAQTWLLAGIACGWALLSLLTGLLHLVEPLGLSMGPAGDRLHMLYELTITVIVMVLNLIGFLLISEKLSSELLQLATMDSLTGVYNRSAFNRAAAAFSLEHGPSGYLLLLDLDHFKQINDCHGHAAGDAALRAFSVLLRRTTRGNDIVGRMGGETFCIFLPMALEIEAIAVAERLRNQVTMLDIQWENQPVRMSVSIGVAPMQPSARGLDATMTLAERALVAAKRLGRNRVIHARDALDLADEVTAHGFAVMSGREIVSNTN